MSDRTHIEWTDASWNPVTGCTQVSPGCARCYAKTFAERFRGVSGHPYEQGFDVRLWPERLDLPLRWRKPRRIFVNSMSDLFHEDVPDGFIVAVWMKMTQAYWHTFQVLTKRPERMRDFLTRWYDHRDEHFGEFRDARGPAATRAAHPSGRGQLFASYLEWLGSTTGGEPPPGCAWPTFDWMEGPMRWSYLPPPHIWVGTSVELQRWADERIPHLLATPAAVRFLSCEPLLSQLDLRRWLNAERPLGGISWLICGGESGPRARPMDIAWARSLVAQCQAAGTPAFVKQLGANVRDRNDAGFEGDTPTGWPAQTLFEAPGRQYQGEMVRVRLRSRKGGDMAEWPEDLRVREWPRGVG